MFIQNLNISIDIQQLTQRLNVEETRMLCLQSLNSEIDISQANTSFIKNIYNLNQKAEEIKHDSDDEPFGLKTEVRTKKDRGIKLIFKIYIYDNRHDDKADPIKI